uniref:Membrane protein required for colicin V production n=1 Tax=Candidatus Kentrum sp. FM TaxID=2126340 RepID=A0A450TDS7_9GAMM|nr:MAG: membrane protein required for colicin V production [Candidatus Kentron sp. FM]VFJ65123.1 MAG: membrane protein required for colicin V production [Candidatus Kentron sp. FM]VFK15922.1 MAG: membrane protein required for colicin V production [Candidatus Kentron sp. FM]
MRNVGPNYSHVRKGGFRTTEQDYLMNWADFIILAIIGISAIFSISRGFISEALSLFGWILAFWLGFTFMHPLAMELAPWIDTPSVRLIIAFVALVVITLLLTALVNGLIGRLVEKTGLTGTDRMLGIIFGAVRGIAIVAICVLLLDGLTVLPADPWWQESMLLGRFQELATEIRGLLPPELAGYLTHPDSPPVGIPPR